MVDFDDKLDEDEDLDDDEEQFRKRVRKLAIRLQGYYAKEVFVKATLETVPHVRGNVTEKEHMVEEKTMTEDMAE